MGDGALGLPSNSGLPEFYNIKQYQMAEIGNIRLRPEKAGMAG